VKRFHDVSVFQQRDWFRFKDLSFLNWNNRQISLSLSLSLSLSSAQGIFQCGNEIFGIFAIKRFFSFLKNFLISKKHFKIFCRLPDSLLQAGDMISARHEARSICREFSSEAPIVAG
jgi:hypothetical protein